MEILVDVIKEKLLSVDEVQKDVQDLVKILQGYLK